MFTECLLPGLPLGLGFLRVMSICSVMGVLYWLLSQLLGTQMALLLRNQLVVPQGKQPGPLLQLSMFLDNQLSLMCQLHLLLFHQLGLLMRWGLILKLDSSRMPIQVKCLLPGLLLLQLQLGLLSVN